MTDNSCEYVCVNCGSHVKSLYKQYSPTVLKLCNCEACGKVADKYLEYDKVIVLIDIILFSKEAYRHVLYNVQYKSHFKLALLQLIVLSFDECLYGQKSVNLRESNSYYESVVCLITLATLLGKILFFTVILLCIFLHYKWSCNKPLIQKNIIKILEAIICSSFGYFLLLTISIWDDSQREILLVFINTYITLSQIQALTVTTPAPRPFLGTICIAALIADRLLSSYSKWIFGV